MNVTTRELDKEERMRRENEGKRETKGRTDTRDARLDSEEGRAKRGREEGRLVYRQDSGTKKMGNGSLCLYFNFPHSIHVGGGRKRR
ncbi:hypothetical protein E2C01_069605 [Portunus trituberculatus]|uniref:Uncharacterized protein n=1 Tax=Portunus trituberculatus TaxID=210409 RepID=A0A5B7HQH2_PORTR|nr:hypothetical protein [Portunus trituberculatus]